MAYIGSGLVLLDDHDPLDRRHLLTPPRVAPLAAAALIVLLAPLALLPATEVALGVVGVSHCKGLLKKSKHKKK